jgi:hypothetical protein
MTAQTCFTPASEFVSLRAVSCEGDPDHVIVKNGELVAVVEDKGKWSVPGGNLVSIYGTVLHRSVTSALDQIYHYMRLNHVKHGITVI